MEYLPRDQDLEVESHVKSKEEGLKKYRQFLVDSGVVKAIAKCKRMKDRKCRLFVAAEH